MSDQSRKLSILVPGSSANLGPGFDALALALSIHTKMSFELREQEFADGPSIQYIGELKTALSGTDESLVEKILRKVWHNRTDLLERIVVEVQSDIPLARGLGSSAAATVGTIWAARYLADESLEPGSVIAEAAAFEGHPDNAAASLLGGMVASAGSQNGKVLTQKLEWPDDWKTILVVPQYELATSKARKVLPENVSMADVVSNLQNVALLTAAVANRDKDALACALHDRLHEPYRESLVPELAELRKQLVKLPVLGCVLSGAGSSILIIAPSSGKQELKEFLAEWAAGKTNSPVILDLEVDNKGLRQIHE